MTPKTPHPVRRIAVFACSTFLLLVILFLASLPSLLSTGWGKDAFIRFLNQSRAGKMNCQSLSLSWFGTQKAEGVEFGDQNLTFICEEIRTDASLWTILLHRSHIGNLELMSPKLTLKNEINQANAPSPFPKTSEKQPSPKKEWWAKMSYPFLGTLTVQEGQLQVLQPGLDLIQFQHISIQASHPNDAAPLSLTMKGETEQDRISGNFQLTSTLTLFKNEEPSLELQAKLLNLPVKGIDQILTLFNPSLKDLLIESIGPSLNLDVNGKSSSQMLELSLGATSLQFNAQIHTTSQEGKTTLKSPIIVDMTLTPTFADNLLKVAPVLKLFRMKESAHAKLRVDELLLPISERGIDFQNLQFQGQFELTPTKFYLTTTSQEMTLGAFKASITTAELKEALKVRVDGLINFNEIVSRVTSDLQFLKLGQSQVEGTFSLDATSFPLLLIDQLLEQTPWISLTIGPTLDFNLSGLLSSNQSNQFSLKVKSPQLELTSLNFTLEQELQLKNPVTLHYLPSPTLVAFTQKFAEFQVAQASPLEFTLESLSLPFSHVERMAFSANLKMPRLEFNQLFIFKHVALDELQCSLRVSTWDQIELSLQEARFRTQIEGALKKEKDLFILKKPVLLDYTFSRDQFRTLFPSLPLLTDPATLQVSIKPFSLPFSRSKNFKINGQASIDALKTTQQNTALALQNLSCQFQADTAAGKAYLSLAAQATENKKPSGNVQADLALDHLLFDPGINTSQANLVAKLKVNNLSTSFLEKCLDRQDLSQAIGTTLNGQLGVTSTPTDQSLSLQAKSQYLTLSLPLSFKQGILQSSQASISFVLTPQGYALIEPWMTSSRFDLKEASTWTLSLSLLSAKIPSAAPSTSLMDRFPSLAIDWSQLEITGSGKIDRFSLIAKDKKGELSIDRLTTTFDKSSSTAPISFQLDSLVHAGMKEGKVAIIGKFYPFLEKKNLKASLQADIVQLPVALLDLFLKTPTFTPLFGNTLNASLSADIQNSSGPIRLNIHSPQTRVSLAGNLNEGIFSLNESVHAQIAITPELSSHFLKDINPLSISAIASNNPMTLTIDPKGVSVPLFPSDIAQTTIPNIRLELGQITCYNEGNLNITLGLLRSRQFSKDKNLKLWFAPMDMHLEKGIIDCERTEILVADTFDIATWGKIDLVSDYVDMVLGLTADCLNAAFGIKNLPANYMIQIPLKGPTDNVQINTGKATAKITALLVWQQKAVAGALGKGTGGAILGGFLNALGTLPDKNSKSPPPKHPFPWEESRTSEKAEKKKSHHKTHLKPQDKPLKQLLKILTH